MITSTFAFHIFCSASSTQRHCSPEVQALVNQISCALWYGNTSKEALQVSNYSDLKLYITALKAMSSAVLLGIVMCGVVKKERFKHTLVQHCQAKACHPVFLFLFLGDLTWELCKVLRKKNWWELDSNPQLLCHILAVPTNGAILILPRKCKVTTAFIVWTFYHEP